MEITPGCRLGSYQVQAQVGAGAMGTVFRATDTKLGRDVAIKVLPPGLADAPGSLARFQREARMLAALNHPNIATIHGFEQAGDAHYLVMELVPGDTLAQRLTLGPVPLPEALKIAAQIVEALEAAHRQSIVHRDLKPANIKVTPEGRVKVLDFGLAKAFELGPARAPETQQATATLDDPTRIGQVMGTPAYMSPEQVRAVPLDQGADVWAFGCILFELLSGRRPFAGATQGDLFAAILTKDPDWQALPASTPPELRDLLRKCLEKEGSRRLRDIGEARRVIEAAGTAAPPKRGSARNAWLAVASAVTVAAIAAALNLGGLRDRLTGVNSAPIRSIAVLPLENLSKDPAQTYFADGTTDALITDLSKLGALKVISLTSAMQYKGSKKPLRDIASELHVDAIVEGAVMQADGRVRISARLTKAATETPLWAENYTRDLKDVLTLQDDVARQIAAGVQLTLTPEEQTRLTSGPVDPEAYQLYLQAQFALDQDSVPLRKQAVQLFERAIQKDPKYAKAYAGLALTYGSFGRFYEEPNVVMPKAREAALKAISLDETLSEAHTALATVRLQYDWDWQGAEQELRRAIQLNRSSADAHDLYAAYYTASGNFQSALSEIQLAREYDPLSLRYADRFLYVLVFFKNYDRTIAEANAILAKHPDFVMAYAWKAMALVMQGHAAEAVEAQKRAFEIDPNPGMKIFLAVAEAAAGKKGDALQLAHQVEDAAKKQYVCNYEIAQIYASMGDRDQAFKWLKSGVGQQCDCMIWLQGEPWMQSLKADPRYLDLIKRVGFDRLPATAGQ